MAIPLGNRCLRTNCYPTRNTKGSFWKKMRVEIVNIGPIPWPDNKPILYFGWRWFWGQVVPVDDPEVDLGL